MKKPLAYQLRPEEIKDIVGQEHLLGENQVLRNIVESQAIPSMIFFGPPGTGKTTTAIAIADSLGVPYRLFNAVTDNKKALDALFLEARMTEGGLVVIVDEVHRLNKDKQDHLLPHIESGLITMIGATTANPYFSINPAIRSRVQLFEFLPLASQEIKSILHRIKTNRIVDEEVIDHLAKASNGDARFAINSFDVLMGATKNDPITLDDLKRISISMNISMDKDSDHYYDLLSGFQKSIRGSDVNASLYYLAKLIHVGDFDSLERRLITTAYEDIGLANPGLCSRVITTLEGCKKIGFPEARILVSNIVIECALSPKSKSAEIAIDSALSMIEKTAYQVPKYLRLNAVGMEEEDKYDYDRSDLWHKIQYLPKEIKNEKFYQPQNLNSAEKTYASNYQVLNQYKRSDNLRELKKKK